MLYELINMSDPYTFKADDLECAALATILLGRGQYGAKPLDGQNYDGMPDHGVPIMIVGSGPEWFQNKFGKSIPDAMNACLEDQDRRMALVETLRSVVIGRGAEERAAFDEQYSAMAHEKREEWRQKRHDEKLTSLNDIGGRALITAKFIEETGSFVGAPMAPRQVF